MARRFTRLVPSALIACLLLPSAVDAAPVGAASFPRARPPRIAAAGDIASPGNPSRAQRRTARLVGRLDPRAVLVLGDTQYDDGRYRDYLSSYDPTWGRFLGRTHPVPGNHEYHTPGARGYFRYFGRRAHPRNGGYYSFDLGAWHLIALNSKDGDRPSARQLRWLRRDLLRNRDRCELAYWHHPRFSSGVVHGSSPAMAPYWIALYAAGVDVVLNGHEHNYERFKRMRPTGTWSRSGIRQFVVGTGGKERGYRFRDRPLKTSQTRRRGLGVLSMQLRPGGYRWRFLRPGGFVADRGRDTCHR